MFQCKLLYRKYYLCDLVSKDFETCQKHFNEWFDKCIDKTN